ncbi:MAG: DUF4097 family beta strand repeat-containing protein [Clostridiaceae bacterium]
MNRNFLKILIVLWSLIALFFTGLLLYGITSGQRSALWNFPVRFGSLSIQKEEEASVNNCEKIYLDFSSENVEVSPSRETTLKVVQEARGTLKESEKFVLSNSGNTIEISKSNSWVNLNLFRAQEIKIKLYIPESYNKDLEIITTSGNIDYNSDTELNAINLKTTSGNITASNLKIKSYNIESTSGNIKASSISGSGYAKSTSGNIKMTYIEILNEANVSSNSGNLDLSAAKGMSFEFHGKSSSGNIKSNLDLNYKNQNGTEAVVTVGEGPYKKINASSSSGDIKITD